jgi:hypothetical protein
MRENATGNKGEASNVIVLDAERGFVGQAELV